MGQRLVIQITDHGEPIASAYYHWSAYTGSAAELTNDVLDWLDDADKSFTNKQKAVWALYKTGARFNPIEESRLLEHGIKNYYSFAFDDKTVDRNNGLICVTEEGMQEHLNWEEGHVDIDIWFDEIYFNVIGIEAAEDYKKACKEYDMDPFEKLPVLKFDWEKDTEDNSWACLELTREKWASFYLALRKAVKRLNYTLKSPGGTIVYELIE